MVNNTVRFFALTLMIFFGAFWILVFKTQNSQIVVQGGETRSFFHPYIQVVVALFGEALALPLYYIYKYFYKQLFEEKKDKAQKQGKQIQFNKYLLAIPSLCDCMASTLQLVSLNFIASSVYQMIGGGKIVTTFLFSILVLKIKAEKHQIIGSVLVFIGVAIVGISNIVFTEQASGTTSSNLLAASTEMQIGGYIMLIASLFFSGFQLVFEQMLFNKYHIQPLQMAGIQGLFGVIFTLITMTIVSFIPCSFAIDACAITSSGEYYLQSPSSFLKSIGDDGFLLSAMIIGAFGVLGSAVSGISVTKYINALARSIGGVSTIVLIWLVGIIVTVTAGESNSMYKWESLNPSRMFVQLVGFLGLIAGNLVYNSIIKLGCLQQNEQRSQGLLQKRQDQDYIIQNRSTQ